MAEEIKIANDVSYSQRGVQKGVKDADLLNKS